MLRFHANVYAMPSDTAPGESPVLRGIESPTLRAPSGGPPAFLRTLPVTFEAMQQRLVESERCDCEPDGFFLLTGEHEGSAWRLSGHMFEYGESMYRVELNGECPRESLDVVLQALGWPDTELAFELVQEGVTLRESDFRRWAAAVEGDPARDVATKNDPPRASHAVSVVAPKTLTPIALNHTPWHITFGTYGTRLHGDSRPTVDRTHNQLGEPFVAKDDARKARNEQRLAGEAVRLTVPQRLLIEDSMPVICERGGWLLRAVAAQEDHVHVVCDLPSDLHGEGARRLIKRWLTEALNPQWPDATRPRWWAVQGSNKAIRDEAYLRNAVEYVERQCTRRA